MDVGIWKLVGITVAVIAIVQMTVFLWNRSIIFGLFGFGVSLVAVATWIEVRSS